MQPISNTPGDGITIPSGISSLQQQETRSPDSGVTDHMALPLTNDFIVGASLHIPNQPTQSGRASAQSSVPSSLHASPHLAPRGGQPSPTLAPILQHAPPPLIGSPIHNIGQLPPAITPGNWHATPAARQSHSLAQAVPGNWQAAAPAHSHAHALSHSQSMPQGMTEQQRRLGEQLLRQQSMAKSRLPLRPNQPSSSKPGWVDLYDQKSDHESDQEGSEGDRERERDRRRGSSSDEEDESVTPIGGGRRKGISKSSSSASLTSNSSSKSLASSTKHQRKSIGSSLKGLSKEALEEVERTIRRLQQKGGSRKKKHSKGRSSIHQVEGASEGKRQHSSVDEEEEKEGLRDAESSDAANSSDDDAESVSGSISGPSSRGASREVSEENDTSNLAAAPLAPVVGSPVIGLPSLGMQRNWNQEFQLCFTAICNDATILDNVVGYSALSALAHDFLWTASTLGKIIISEMQLPERQKTIPSIDVGGYAGGTKYIAHNILFKFAVDNADSLYGGDEFAMKAAGHELLGLSHYYRTIASSEGRLGLHVPLAALIDFRGYRLYAICKLPIEGSNTLVLGSCDGGNHIINKSPELDSKMKQVAEILNLKVHAVTDGQGRETMLPSCFDIEGHLGRDGRFYLLDYHRTFPPEPPAQILQQQLQQEGWTPPEDNGFGEKPKTTLADLHKHQSKTVLKNTYLYRLLRPELVRSYTAAPLSSNVYSVFDRDPENYRHVLLCFRGLIERVIPTFAKALEKNPPPSKFIDSGVQMQQQTANMIRTSSGGGGGQGNANSNASMQTPRMSRSPSISSMVSPSPPVDASSVVGGLASSTAVGGQFTHHLPPPTLSLDVLSSVLHQSGINVRYLGLVRSHMNCPSWRAVLLVEILARLLKNELRSRWRSIRLKSMSDGPFRAAAVQFINLIFFPSLASNTFWAEHLHSQINLHYPGTLVGDEADPRLWNLKQSLTHGSGSVHTAAQPHQSRGTAGGKHQRQRSGSAFTSYAASPGASPHSHPQPSPSHVHHHQHDSCSVHHSTHTHVGVDPADPLAFLPPLNAAMEKEKPVAPNDAPDGPASAPPTSSPQPSPSSNPDLLRSPSLPVASASIAPPPSLSQGQGRSVSTSVGYVKQPSHLPASALASGSGAQTTPPKKHHVHSASTPAVAVTQAPPQKKKPSILDPAPDIPCPAPGCCHPGGGTDYLLLLFMRFIQLSGIVLEEGIVEAIQGAAEKQAMANQPPEMVRQSSSGGTGPIPYDDSEHVPHPMVGEGTLQLDRATGVGMHHHHQRHGSTSHIPAPHALHHRAVTEPRGPQGPNVPPSPPPLAHAASSVQQYPPLSVSAGPAGRHQPQHHVNSPSTNSGGGDRSAPPAIEGRGMPRNLSGSNLSVAMSTISSPVIHTPSPGVAGWRPHALHLGQHHYTHSASAPQTPPSASGRNTPHGHEAMEGFPRSRSGSFIGMMPLTHSSSNGLEPREKPNPGEIWNLWSWPFVAPLEDMHIRGLIEKVKQVNLLWYAEGTSLLIKAWQKLQQHNRWIADQHHSQGGSSATANTKDVPQGLAHTFNQKRFFLPGHLQQDDVFKDGPTPFLKMSFHLAGLAANKYQQALKYSLNDPLTLCNLSFLMSAVYNKYASAMSYLKRAILANPMHVRSYYYLGQLYQYHLHDYNQARICYEKALSLAPHGRHANTLKDYGNLMQYGFSNPQEAAAKYKKALEVEPSHIKSLQLLANLTTRQCDTLKQYDEIKKLLYDAARSPMGVVETRLNAQEKYINFLTVQAELYAEEHAHSLAHPAVHAHTANGPVNNLREARERWQEAIDFLQCPHLHYGSSKDNETGTSEIASGTGVSQALISASANANVTANSTGDGLSTLSLTPSANTLSQQHRTANQFMVSSQVIKPQTHPLISNVSSTQAKSPALSRVASESIGSSSAAAAAKKAASAAATHNDLAAPPSSKDSESSAADVPAAGFSWCVCPDCCAVNTDALPLADTLLSYAQFIFQYESVPPPGLTPTQSHAHTSAKLIEAEKWFQWSILVHHTLVTSRKKHRQVQMKYEMHPEAIQALDTATVAALTANVRSPNTLSKSGLTPYHSTHTSNAHEVLASSGPLAQSAYAFVPPAVKTAYLMTAPAFPAAPAPAAVTASNPSAAPPSVASASNASVLLEVAAPFLTPGWLSALGVHATFAVIVSKPNPVSPPPQPAPATVVKETLEVERRLRSFSVGGGTGSGLTGGSGVGISILSSIASPTNASANSATAVTTTTNVTTGAPPVLTRPASSWDSSNPKKWQNLPAVIPGSTPASASAKDVDGKGKLAARSATGTGTWTVKEKEQVEKDLFGAELALEIDLEFDGVIERSCECAVDHSFGEAATACSCSFPNPRYLVCYAFFLMRTNRSAQAAYAFQSALVLHPFGRTGSTCLARMVDCAVRSGILQPGPHYAANVVTVYGLYRKAVGLDAWEGAREGDKDESIANRHTFVASLTAATLFSQFLREHSNAVGPIVSAPSTPSSTTSSNSSISQPPQIGPLLKGADATMARVNQIVEAIRADMANQATAFKNSIARPSGSPSYAVALVNAACKCRRPLRGKVCLCNNQVLKGMIQKTHQMRSKLDVKRRAVHGELQHGSSGAVRKPQQRGSSQQQSQRGGRGGAKGLIKRDSTEEQKSSTSTAATDESSSDTAPPIREGSGKWAQLVVKSASNEAQQAPKRTPSGLSKESSKEAKENAAKTLHVSTHTGGGTTTSSGQSTPAIATPVSASPQLAPVTSTSTGSNLASVPPLNMFPPASLVAAAQAASSVGVASTFGGGGMMIGIVGPSMSSLPPTVLPTSQWKAPPSLANNTNILPPPTPSSSTITTQPLTTPTATPAAVPSAFFAGPSFTSPSHPPPSSMPAPLFFSPPPGTGVNPSTGQRQPSSGSAFPFKQSSLTKNTKR